ncbi:SAM-dependent methyltransferase [Bacillus sp. CGMCC 1.16607]|uniref:SAM-dependent methyltransferase n=1 Tax=Bacillus sp. CGMCC 1.16607 TaxID=3351842 RepID=UPI00363060D8
MSNRVENWVKMASASGESIKSNFTNNKVQTMLLESGLLIYEHLTPNGIQELFFRDRTDYLCAFETVYFIHTVKR